MLETGIVKSIDTNNHTARVQLTTRDNIISAPLRYLDHVDIKLDKVVVCIFDNKQSKYGYIIGVDGS